MNVIAEAAHDLLSAGFSPIPVPPRSKNPNRDGWQNERWTAADVSEQFLPNLNIGVHLGKNGNNRLDVDCDCPEAIQLAPAFLPRTNFVHGRPSRPRSHFWYVGDPVPEHKKFEVNGESLLELRAVGQTVVPPSIHPSGEQLAWDEADGTPPTIPGDMLSRAVRELAAATLVARHYPREGSRHEFSLALAGFLQRQGWDKACVSHFVVATATAAGDEEVKDRENGVETTADRLATGGAAIGGGRLREMLGNAAFDRVCEWLGFAKFGHFASLPTVEADNVPAEEIPAWPVKTLEGDYLSDLAWLLTNGTTIPPQFVREEIIAALAALADGWLGYPLHRDLPLRRFLALISERAQAGKGESWKRVAGNTGEGGALLPLIAAGNVKLQDGSGVGSGQYLAAKLEETPRMICHWDEGSQLFQVSGQQNSTLLSALKTLYESNSYHTGSFTNRAHGTDDAHFSALLHSTRKTFVEGFAFARGAGDGLLSRFTLAYCAGMPVVAEWEPRDLGAERRKVAIIGELIPKVPTVPAIADDARGRMNEFARALGVPDHPRPDHVRRLVELTKIDVLHRCIYSGSPQISLEMMDRSIAWAEHQLTLRVALWPPDAKDEAASMTKVMLSRLRKGNSTARDLRKSANVDRDGSHELFNRCLSALVRSRKVIIPGKNSRGYEIYALEPDDAEAGASE